MTAMKTLDWTIVIAFLVANLVLGAVLGRRVSSAREYISAARARRGGRSGFGGGHLCERPVVPRSAGLGLFGRAVGAGDPPQLPAGDLRRHHSVPAFFYNSGVASIYEYQERRFGPASRSVMSSIFLLTQALTTGAILYATGVGARFRVGHRHSPLDPADHGRRADLYGAGRMLAVIWTDVFQAVVLFTGALVIGGVLLANLPAPLTEVLAGLKAQGRLNVAVTDLDITRSTTIWSGVIAMTLFHMTVYGANQMMVQRTLGARTIGGAKKAYLLMGFAAVPIYCLFFFVGVLCFAFYRGRTFENPNEIILNFAARQAFRGWSAS
jgi:SSS family solute:Na+ symporter